jgi:hypothetical protein
MRMVEQILRHSIMFCWCFDNFAAQIRLDSRAPMDHSAMATPQKRSRGDDAPDESIGLGAGVVSMSTSQSSSSLPILLINGEAVLQSFVYTTMCRPPAILYLLVNGQVSFQSSVDVAASCSHGTWVLSPDLQTLRVSFHYAGILNRLREHVFRRIEQTDGYALDVIYSEYKVFLHRRIYP